MQIFDFPCICPIKMVYWDSDRALQMLGLEGVDLLMKKNTVISMISIICLFLTACGASSNKTSSILFNGLEWGTPYSEVYEQIKKTSSDFSWSEVSGNTGISGDTKYDYSALVAKQIWGDGTLKGYENVHGTLEFWPKVENGKILDDETYLCSASYAFGNHSSSFEMKDDDVLSMRQEIIDELKEKYGEPPEYSTIYEETGVKAKGYRWQSKDGSMVKCQWPERENKQVFYVAYCAPNADKMAEEISSIYHKSLLEPDI